MKIQILSDLHLEFTMYEGAQAPDADVVVLAGDIHTGTDAVAWIEKQFKVPVIYVAGNHEFYHHQKDRVMKDLKERTKDTNIHFLDKETVEIDGVTFFGATFWTDFELNGDKDKAMNKASLYMNDYYAIRKDPGTALSTKDTLEEHKETIKALKEELNKHAQLVVVSHHGPTEKSIEEKYKKDPMGLSPAYASDLAPLIKGSGIDLWVHGHVHHNTDYRCYSTRVVTNPRGYQMKYDPRPENPQFDKHMVVEV